MSLPAPRDGSAALITGASAGIGAELARQLAARGHNVILVARRRDRLKELAGQLTTAHGVQAQVISCDLASATARGRMIKQVQTGELAVDVLVNNAGFATGGALHLADAARELEQVRVLVEAVVALSTAFSPAMVERRRGAILNLASTAGMQPLPYSAGYSAAKAHTLAFSEALHYELAPLGVTVTALAPGPVSTDFWKIAGWKTAGGKRFERTVPRQAWVTPAEAAAAGIHGLESGRRVVIPGASVRAAMAATRYVPNALKLPITAAARRRG